MSKNELKEFLDSVPLENKINFLEEMNRAILLPDEPEVGDYIATDLEGAWPSHFKQNISWYCAEVVEKKGNKYLVSYDCECGNWYEFNYFGIPKVSEHGNLIYPARPDPV